MPLPEPTAAASGGRHWPLLEELLIRTPRAIDPLLRAGRPWLAAFSTPRLPVKILRGPGGDGPPRSVLLAGRGALADRLISCFFDDVPVHESAPPCSLPGLRARLSAAMSEVDLVLAVVPRPLAGTLADRRFLRVPTVVEFVIDTTSAIDLKRAGRSLRADVRKTLAAGFTARLSQDSADLERFYRELYLPMLARRFGKNGHPQPMLTLRRRLRAGGLVWLDHDGRTVGGDVFEIRGDTMRLLVHGRRPTGDPKLDALVQLAANRAAMEIGRRRGCRMIDLGAAMPILGSGLFARKRAYGAAVRPRARATHELLIGWRQCGPAVQAFLGRAPLAIRQGDRLEALTAMEGSGSLDPRAAARLHRALLPDGIDRLAVCAGEGWAPAAPGWAIPGPEALSLVCPLSSAELAGRRS
jgi:hypothetical protein